MKEYYNDVFDIWVSYDEEQVKKNDIYLLKGIQLLLVVLLPLIIVKVVKAETSFKASIRRNQLKIWAKPDYLLKIFNKI